jgi:hypothetical protein
MDSGANREPARGSGVHAGDRGGRLRSDMHDRVRDQLRRPGITLLLDVKNAQEAAATRAEYVVVVSSTDPGGVWGDSWPFTEARGLRPAARFDANPYEHSFDITATWGGRRNVIVLQR